MERDEDIVHKQWSELPEGAEKQLQEEILAKLLSKHAHAVCWLMLGEHRGDIVNDAIYRVFTKQETFKGDSKFSTWFQAIVANLCKMELRDSDAAETTDLEEADKIGTSSKAMEAKVQVEEIRDKLPDKDKELVDFKLAGLTDVEIGEQLNVSRDVVKKRWERLKARVKNG